jgi:hypothetical protein
MYTNGWCDDCYDLRKEPGSIAQALVISRDTIFLHTCMSFYTPQIEIGESMPDPISTKLVKYDTYLLSWRIDV